MTGTGSMEHGRLAKGDPGVEITFARFSPSGGGAAELHLHLRVPNDRPFDAQLSALETAHQRASRELGLPADSALFRRLFLSDAANQEDKILASAIGADERTALSLVEQPPLPAAKLACWAYHIVADRPLAKQRLSAATVALGRGPLTRLWTGGVLAPCLGEADAGLQTRALFDTLTAALATQAANPRTHAIRTWLFVANIDKDYSAMAADRRRLFAEHGLTAPMPFRPRAGVSAPMIGRDRMQRDHRDRRHALGKVLMMPGWPKQTCILVMLTALALAALVGCRPRSGRERQEPLDLMTEEDRARFEHLTATPTRPPPPDDLRVTEEDIPALRDALAALAEAPSASPQPLLVRYPLPGTLYPADMAAPLVWWDAEEDDYGPWLIAIRLRESGQKFWFATNEPRWRPPSEAWTQIRAACLGQSDTAHVTVTAFTASSTLTPVARGETHFSVSLHPVEAPLVYRQVPLPITIVDSEDVVWSVGHVASDEPPRTLATGLTECMNCHHAALDGSLAAWDYNSEQRDRSHYVTSEIGPVIHITQENVFDWHQADSEHECAQIGACQAGFAKVSPDGRHIVSPYRSKTTNVLSPTHSLTHSIAVAFHTGILGIYSVATGAITPLPGADDPRYAHNMPDWTPDGRKIVFQRHAVDEAHERRSARLLAQQRRTRPDDHELYMTIEEFDEVFPHPSDLYIIPFNEGRGGSARPIPGAGNNGMNNYHPRVSPDGRWIVFNQSHNGVFIRPDANLYIIPLEGGTARPLASNSAHMDSWHSWSPNSKWLAFASKRDGPYTNVYLTHIDEHGADSPPVILARFRGHGYAINLPEFFNAGVDDLQEMNVEAQIPGTTRCERQEAN